MRRTIMAALSMLALAYGGAGALAQTAGGQTAQAQAATVQDVQVRGIDWTPLTAASGGLSSVDRLMGRTVYGSDGRTVGKVTDVLLDGDGQARQLVVRSGGFLGLGSSDRAIDVGLAQTRLDENGIRLRDLTRDQVMAMPPIDYDDGMTSLNRSPRSHDRATGAAE
ncbi:PRC-barrel domain-containing protein [Azospirillum sp. SYSU D00513]|uniref:PRC-barrel domain-containing protein n=1 Tax=Azospirillum sp. SYSU D00513 TaxID=2812561 RepID=UPI001A976A06|nr:PRC-barrel domain-containing protein [Azospirillum sp. SYSU D00513]